MKTFLKNKPRAHAASINITSLIDIFIILLVFLLKSFSSSVIQTNLSKPTRLAVASASPLVKDSLKLEISPNMILVDERPVVATQLITSAEGALQEVPALRRLYDALSAERQRPRPNMDSSLLVMADERVSYGVLKEVLRAASASGFVDLGLVVVQRQ